MNYAGRGLTYDWEGHNRNINVSKPTVAERKAINPNVPDDPDVLFVGKAVVRVTEGREADPHCDENFQKHFKRTRLADFVAHLGSGARALAPQRLHHRVLGIADAFASAIAVVGHSVLRALRLRL